MPEVWFTADTHFGHQGLILNGWRPGYDSVDEMDDDLISRWNAVVKRDDIVWHLGDFALGPEQPAMDILAQLNGEIHLIVGNHDRMWPGGRQAHKYVRPWLDAGFASIQFAARRRVGGQNVLLSHLPYQGDHGEERFTQFRLPDEGLPLLHGHVHGEWKIRGHQINVGVDVWELAPVHLVEITAIVQKILADRAVQSRSSM